MVSPLICNNFNKIYLLNLVPKALLELKLSEDTENKKTASMINFYQKSRENRKRVSHWKPLWISKIIARNNLQDMQFVNNEITDKLLHEGEFNKNNEVTILYWK